MLNSGKGKMDLALLVTNQFSNHRSAVPLTVHKLRRERDPRSANRVSFDVITLTLGGPGFAVPFRIRGTGRASSSAKGGGRESARGHWASQHCIVGSLHAESASQCAPSSKAPFSWRSSKNPTVTQAGGLSGQTGELWGGKLVISIARPAIGCIGSQRVSTQYSVLALVMCKHLRMGSSYSARALRRTDEVRILIH